MSLNSTISLRSIVFCLISMLASVSIATEVADGSSYSEQIASSAEQHIPTWLIFLCSISLISTVFSLFIAYKFYTWRTQLRDTGALTPEEWSQYLGAVGNRTDENTTAVKSLEQMIINQISFSEKSYHTLQESFKTNLNQNESVKEMLLTFQKTLSDKDTEIDRLKKGYDFTILKKTLVQLSSLHAECVEILSKDLENRNLKNFEVLFSDVLESAGVIIEAPDIGTDFSQIADYIEVVGFTTNSQQNLEKGQISEVLSKLYLYKSEDKITVLKKSKVKYHLPKEDAHE